MDSAQHCQDQASECHRLVKSAQSEIEAKNLKELANSWMRVAGQIDRYHALKREQLRNASVCA
ncbi:hypothetical protein JQ582_37260 [Bradyrhizobium japonicum]|jgi:hypothetical protein|uniref:hypothetical protein n=1 Tax=Bradyrhizobium TaxID=374 RepID=UPI001BA6B464|nr:hypothetical protein [Bradyrhizobium japonicum]MBR0734851.1 hypothetical protein [Bradyrhizobium japonicum]MBR0749585.1 hypothetical protein [Bradyrhizobium japonicum]MBR0808449.1 hypothetical protein [Bradyrhizobium japonicum]